MKYTVGIDPGLHGAICFYATTPIEIEIHDMPTHTITINNKKKKRLDIVEIARLIDVKSGQIKECYIESVTASPQMGTVSAFTFGETFGIVQGIMAANFIPVKLIRPQLWKKHFGLTSDKDASRRKASSLFPSFAGQWQKVKDDGRAEALLIAVHGTDVI